MTPRHRAERVEWTKCWHSPAYFLSQHGWVYDATVRHWLEFDLWPAQLGVCRLLASRRLVCVLKARQLGLSWLAVGFSLWLMLFRPAATVLLFSRRDDEAVHLLEFRLRGMYDRLPGFMQTRDVLRSSGHELRLSNGSVAMAFPTTGGRSYTASLVIVDEADYVGDLDRLLNAVKPTIDAGGRLVLISTVDKGRPESAFKRVFRGGERGENGWQSIFLGWNRRPGRTRAWYAEQQQDVLARTGALDDLFQEYPATALEALAPRSLDRRFAAVWLRGCDESEAQVQHGARAHPDVDSSAALVPPVPVDGLTLYREPEQGQRYVIGADPAEGNPLSDESAATVLTLDGAQVAELAGRFDPAVFAAKLDQLSALYNNAPIMVERNNHGHAVLLWLREFGHADLLNGLDGKPGWLSSGRGKAVAFDAAADAFREGACRLRSERALTQLTSVEGATLKAPEGMHDDRAVAVVLALAALRYSDPARTGESAVIAPEDVIEDATAGW